MMPRAIVLLRKVASLGPTAWSDCFRAVFELAMARRRLGSREAAELLASSGFGELAMARSSQSQDHAALIGRVAFIIPRVGSHVPWRSDCLVQALAARRWLASRGIASEICIGVRRPATPGIEAHAWLKAGETVVTGGDISGYVQLYGPGDG